jgi:FkbM family methyltransferase
MSFFQTVSFINNHRLAKRHRFSALARFLKWQLSQKINPRMVAYPFIGDTKLWVQKGMTGATGNIYTGLHDFEDMSFLLHFLREEDWFIDIGANIGSYTILAAGVANASCISIEPVPQTFELLNRNIALNGISEKVTACNMGIGSKKGILSFTKNLDTVNHVVPDDQKKERSSIIDITCITLDELIANKPTPRMLKIDVEGFEQEVINGAKGLLGNDLLQAIIIELNGSGGRYGYNEKNIHEQLKGFGFGSYCYEPFSRTLSPVDGFGNLNTIYIKDLEWVTDRIGKGLSFTVFSEKI